MKSQTSLYSRYFTYIKPFTQSPVIKYYGSTIFALLTMSILTIFAIKPTTETIFVLQKQLVSQNEVLQKITQKANDLSLGKKNYDNLNQDIKRQITDAVPDNLNLKSIIAILEQSAKMHEASVSALQIQPLVIDTKTTNQQGILSEVSFVFNTEGNYQNLVSLLQDIRRSSRLISIDNLSMSETSERTTLIMSVSGKAYYLK
ncbi:MAG: type 4a pilus biogenesis protein PilO [Candidatus Daviesbacteria bacterium]|nr:type 4a pilus biogenesis protein PilO [Candidatus Daviesbacteria bacterium]